MYIANEHTIKPPTKPSKTGFSCEILVTGFLSGLIVNPVLSLFHTLTPVENDLRIT